MIDTQEIEGLFAKEIAGYLPGEVEVRFNETWEVLKVYHGECLLVEIYAGHLEDLVDMPNARDTLMMALALRLCGNRVDEGLGRACLTLFGRRCCRQAAERSALFRHPAHSRH